MKFIKGISLYVIYPLLMLGLGFFAGVETEHFFYPGNVLSEAGEKEKLPTPLQEIVNSTDDSHLKPDEKTSETVQKTVSSGDFAQIDTEEFYEAASHSETLSVDTQYVLEETDTITHAIVETVGKLPHKYIGMDRQQFLTAMESYAAYPPLSEKERGFVGLEVLSFSRERVVVQMNYRYLQPGAEFYLAVENNEVVVYLEDQETVYINTGIYLEELPEDIQMQVIQMLWIENEADLYSFLEAYSS